MKTKFGTASLLWIGMAIFSAQVTAAAAGQASPVSQDCRSIQDDAARLACYDRQGGSTGIDADRVAPAREEKAPAAESESPKTAEPPPAPDAAATAPVAAAAAQELTDEIGREDLNGPEGAEEKLSVRGRVTSCRKDLAGKYVFYFDNGQVWRQKDNVRLRWRDCAFDVTISEDFFGYKMQPDGEQKTVRIAREK